MLSYLVFFACIVLILGLLTLALNLQWGFTGLFNAGVVGFYAIGAYTHAILTAVPQPQYVGNLGLPWLVELNAAPLVRARMGGNESSTRKPSGPPSRSRSGAGPSAPRTW